MQPIRIAAISLNQTPLDWDQNRDNLRQGLAEARRVGASLVCFPELCVSGYGCEDAFLWPHTSARALQVLVELLPDTRGLVACFGLPLRVGVQLFNACALVVDGHIHGFAAKRHLAGAGLHYEPRWFRPWPAGDVREVPVEGRSVPVGDCLFEVGGVRIGFEICEDAWVEERFGQGLAQAGARLVLNPSASHFAFGKHALRRQLVLEGAANFDAVYVYANLLGNEAGRAIYDGDALIAEPGDESDGARIVAEARRLSFAPRQVACATVGVRAAPKSADLRNRRLVEAEFHWPVSPREELVSGRIVDGDELGGAELRREQAFGRVIALGLFDYMRKSRSRGFVVSLSGGADSAAVATLVRLMVALGVHELGARDWLERLGWPRELPQGSQVEERLMAELLITVYQATDNSSEVTRDAARELAHNLGATHHELDVESLVQGYRGLIEGALGRSLDWTQDDIALQNIQARVRAPSVWMLANVRGALLLSTSNRSEAAVGYATMDGDTAGGLSPIAGIDKAFLRTWLRWLERGGFSELGELPCLSLITSQAPTAELRPQGAGQTDEDDLMPYVVLDAVERLALTEYMEPRDILTALEERFPQYSSDQIRLWTQRFYRLFARNQWKRERYAPSFHVDDLNLDPKTWCRFPILSGGFERELREL